MGDQKLLVDEMHNKNGSLNAQTVLGKLVVAFYYQTFSVLYVVDNRKLLPAIPSRFERL